MANSWVDIPSGDGIVRPLRYGSDELAVLDVTSDVMTINWTSSVRASEFFSIVDQIADLNNHLESTLQLAGEPEQSVQVADVRGIASDEIMGLCQFIRVDLTDTRSVAWQIVSLDGHDVFVAGFGADTSSIADGNVGLVEKLLILTASGAVDTDQVFESMMALSRRYGQEGTSTVGAST
jgi:hypothetical protein